MDKYSSSGLCVIGQCNIEKKKKYRTILTLVLLY
jgi:hypothetical protein